MSNALAVTAESFESEVLQSPIPVLVDLYADWCMPCRAMGKVLDQLAPRLDGQVKVAKVNVDQEPDLAGAFGVSSIPMLVLFKDGQIADRSVGALSGAAILQMVQKVTSVQPASR
jgi:thioredoxin 1